MADVPHSAPAPPHIQVFVERRWEGAAGRFVHPVADGDVIAGNATIALELLEARPDLAVPGASG